MDLRVNFFISITYKFIWIIDQKSQVYHVILLGNILDAYGDCWDAIQCREGAWKLEFWGMEPGGVMLDNAPWRGVTYIGRKGKTLGCDSYYFSHRLAIYVNILLIHTTEYYPVCISKYETIASKWETSTQNWNQYIHEYKNIYPNSKG